MKISFFILIISFLFVSKTDVKELVLTKEQNETWMKNLRRISLEKQILAIKSRLLSNIYVRPPGDLIRLKTKAEENKLEGLCRLLLMIKDQPLNISNRTQGQNIVRLCELLNENSIQSIETYDSETITSVYGSIGIYGAISIKPKNSQLLKQLKKLNL